MMKETTGGIRSKNCQIRYSNDTYVITMENKTYEEELKYHLSKTIPEQIENLKELGKELDDKLRKLIKQLDGA